MLPACHMVEYKAFDDHLTIKCVTITCLTIKIMVCLHARALWQAGDFVTGGVYWLGFSVCLRYRHDINFAYFFC
jgi:hypothetical protein